MGSRVLALSAAVCALAAAPALAQRADENAVRSADDAFGTSIGNERIGLYSDRDVRGFSPIAAGNVRMEGLYFDMRSNVPSRLLAGQQIRVGLTAQSYAFPAPTGIVDYQLKPFRTHDGYSLFVEAGPHEAYSLEAEGGAGIFEDRLSLNGAYFKRVEEFIPGETTEAWGLGAVSRWRPMEGTEVTAFYGFGERNDDKATPYVFSAGAYLPPEIEARTFAQDWAFTDGYIESFGITVRHPLTSNWSVNAGVFRHNSGAARQTAELFLNTNASGLAGVHRFIDEPASEQRSLSGEARLTGVFRGENLRHTVHLSARAREGRRNFGGSDTVNEGPAQIGERTVLARPAFVHDDGTFDEVTQTALGLGYQLTWRGVGEASLGVQSVDYEKTVTPHLGAPEVITDDPIFPNASIALTVTERLALYAGFTRGLEESPIAPEIAANAYESPPAIRTEQHEIGLRYALTPRLRFVAGYFEVKKPYFNRDGANIFRELGEETHTGVELSLSGLLTDRLNIVAGVVLMDPSVEGEGVESGLIGDRPVGQTDTTARLNLDYRTPWVEGLSIDAAVAYAGSRAASLVPFASLGGDQVETEEFATLDLGFRYRFRPMGRAATLRGVATNVTDEFAWQVMPSGALYVSNPRALRLSLAMDF